MHRLLIAIGGFCAAVLLSGIICSAISYFGSWSAEIDAEEEERAMYRSASWPTDGTR